MSPRSRPVVASRDAAAADVGGARLLGLVTQGVRHLREGAHPEPGEGDLSRIEVVGLPPAEAIRRFTRAAYGVELTFEHA